VKRRKFMSVCFSLVAAVSAMRRAPAARAADSAQKMMRLGFVGSGTPATAPRGVAVFWEHLRELGWVRGQNLVVEELWGSGQYERLPTLMTDAVSRQVDIIVTYNTAAAIAARKATTTIPIVDAIMSDPVGIGLVASLAHPGGNITGLSTAWEEGIPGKWLELLQETAPHLSTVSVIATSGNPLVPGIVEALQAAAATRGLKLQIIEVREPRALENAFDQARRHTQAAVVFPSPVFLTNQQRITALAAKSRLPVVYAMRDFVDAGGLMAYGPDFAVMFRRAADYVDKILKGAKPADLPIEQPTQFELVINLKAAKALGITIPESILLRADEVIR